MFSKTNSHDIFIIFITGVDCKSAYFKIQIYKSRDYPVLFRSCQQTRAVGSSNLVSTHALLFQKQISFCKMPFTLCSCIWPVSLWLWSFILLTMLQVVLVILSWKKLKDHKLSCKIIVEKDYCWHRVVIKCIEFVKCLVERKCFNLLNYSLTIFFIFIGLC